MHPKSPKDMFTQLCRTGGSIPCAAGQFYRGLGAFLRYACESVYVGSYACRISADLRGFPWTGCADRI